jgi:hypothetical protein
MAPDPHVNGVIHKSLQLVISAIQPLKFLRQKPYYCLNVCTVLHENLLLLETGCEWVHFVGWPIVSLLH